MGVIVGNSTTITGFTNAVSANWGASPNTQRFYVLGSTKSFTKISKATATLSVTCYSPGITGNGINVSPSSGCATTGHTASVNGGGGCGTCTGGPAGASGSWFITSYSYSKEVGAPGQESYSGMQYIKMADGDLPGAVIRGVAEGSWTSDSGVTGTADGSTSAGSVSAGGIGRVDTMSVGIVTDVGGGSGAFKDTGQASVSVPYTPIYC